MKDRRASHGKRDGQGMRRGGNPRPVAALLPKLTKAALGRHGFASATLIDEWQAIVGGELAVLCQPEKLSFPRGQRDGGTLSIRADGGTALELQHLSPQILERINVFLGYRAVDRLRLINAPVARMAAPAAEPVSRPRRRGRSIGDLDASVAEIADGDLRDSLRRLAAAILERDSKR